MSVKLAAENDAKKTAAQKGLGQSRTGGWKGVHHFIRLFYALIQRNPKVRRVTALAKPRMERLFNLIFYPLVRVPGSDYFERFHLAELPEYGRWLAHFEKNTPQTWKAQYQWSKNWKTRPLISIVTPLYNTPRNILIECVFSALFQSFQQWELILIDDASNAPDTLNCLSRIAQIKDPRIKVLKNKKNQGTCRSTNRGIRRASGMYIAFLDHDDRLTPNALFEIAQAILEHDRPNLIYSDRDLISPAGKRHDRISKPAWSPESLLSGNYLFHLMVVKKSKCLEIGGYRKEFEGSQDLDFVLRLAEVTDHVIHIPKALYNFRQTETSCSFDLEAKAFIFEKGVKAVQAALDRRKIQGVAYELEHAWRGNYAIRFKNGPAHETIIYNQHQNLAAYLNRHIKSSGKEHILIKINGLEEDKKETDQKLISFFQIPGIGCITAKIVSNDKIIHAGLVNRPDGVPLNLYMDFPSQTPGLLAFASVMRNTALAHPWCCAISKKTWDTLGGFDNAYGGVYTIFDFAMRCLEKGYRNLYVPLSQYQVYGEKSFDVYPEDVAFYKQRWQERLHAKDPYYNNNLSLDHCDMRLMAPHLSIIEKESF